MLTTHISFLATDTVALPGLMYEPETTTKSVAIWLHGMGDSGVFYSPKRVTALAEQLTKRGVALLAFNNRGAHNSKVLYKNEPNIPKREQRFQAGTYYELISECVFDIDGAVAFLRRQGYDNFFLAGHSTGANKICVYDAAQTTKVFTKYVLAGPGDDVGLNYLHLGEKKFLTALSYSREAVKSGKPLKVMPLYSGMHPFSAQSTFDILNPNGDYNTFPYYEATHEPLGRKPLFEEYRDIQTPMLVVAGEHDEAMSSAGGASQALDLLKDQTHSDSRSVSAFQIVPGSDHSFTDHEDEFAARMATWLTQ